MKSCKTYRCMAIAVLIAASGSSTALGQQAITLVGAGATFPQPLYETYFQKFYAEYGLKVSYQATGSGRGIEMLLNREIDFGASDAFLSDSVLVQSKGEILHIPTCMGAVVITYNLPESPHLSLDPQTVSDIFLGKITSWSAPQIQRTNPDVRLPRLPITVVHRQDASGTTKVFSEYLCKVSDEWAATVGMGTALDWPKGYGALGNEGLAKIIQRGEGSIGYMELTFAQTNDISMAAIQNASGEFIAPEIESVTASARVPLPEDTRISFTNTHAAQGYPISSFSWLIVYREQNYDHRSREQAVRLYQFLNWVLTEGQSFNAEMGYAPLDDNARQLALKLASRMTWDDAAVGER